jgi:hypothetical protein
MRVLMVPDAAAEVVLAFCVTVLAMDNSLSIVAIIFIRA